MRRREFIAALGGAAAWPFAARAQRPTPTIGFMSGRSAADSAHLVDAKALGNEIPTQILPRADEVTE
jgi:hypothetical protein